MDSVMDGSVGVCWKMTDREVRPSADGSSGIAKETFFRDLLGIVSSSYRVSRFVESNPGWLKADDIGDEVGVLVEPTGRRVTTDLRLSPHVETGGDDACE